MKKASHQVECDDAGFLDGLLDDGELGVDVVGGDIDHGHLSEVADKRRLCRIHRDASSVSGMPS